MLCRAFVQQAFEEFCARRSWSFLRGEGQLLIDTAKTGTCNVTYGNATVSGGALAYAAADADRQFRIANGPMYSIIAAVAATSYTLDRVYGEATTALTTATVLDAYVTPPADFARWLAVLDVQNNWSLNIWVTEEELNARDAQRSSTGTPWALVSRKLATGGGLIRRTQYELWPYSTVRKTYPYLYIRTPEVLSDTTTLMTPLADRPGALTALALSYAAEWPGPSPDKKNPYFNLALAVAKRAEASAQMDRMEVMDEDVYPTWLQHVDWLNRPGYPGDAKFLQSHDMPYGLGHW
jgi:hypothetical protein